MNKQDNIIKSLCNAVVVLKKTFAPKQDKSFKFQQNYFVQK